MAVIEIKRYKGQDGKPTEPQLLSLLKDTKLSEIPHRFFLPEVILKNLIRVKKAVLKNKEAYIKSHGGNKMTSSVIIFDGKSNSGKTTLAAQIGLFFQPNMTLEKNYAWNIDRLLELIENASPGQVIIMDEAMVINSRSSNSEDNLKLIIALSQVRSKGVFLLFCINSIHQLEKSISLTRADFMFHLKRIGGISGIPKYCIYDEDKMRQLVVKNAGKYSYAGVIPNTSFFTFSRYFPFNDVRYDNMKHDESIKNLKHSSKQQQKDKIKPQTIDKLIRREFYFYQLANHLFDNNIMTKSDLARLLKLDIGNFMTDVKNYNNKDKTELEELMKKPYQNIDKLPSL